MKKSGFDITELLSFEKSRMKNWLDKLRFSHIFLVWFAMVSVYGFVYYYLTSDSNHLFDTIAKVPIHDLWESIYFSFVTATTTGFGDLVPMGAFKIISIAEVVTGLLLLAIVTSKFVSLKQDQIMSELYDISINEKISRLRSSLFLYKQHLNRLSSNSQEGTFKSLDLKNLGMYFTNYEDILVETLTLVTKEDHNSQRIVDLDFDLLARSVVGAATKTIDAGEIFTQNKVHWLKGNRSTLAVVAELNFELLKIFKSSKNLENSTRRSLAKSLKKVSSYLDEIISSH